LVASALCNNNIAVLVASALCNNNIATLGAPRDGNLVYCVYFKFR
jgi:hypothetical protein